MINAQDAVRKAEIEADRGKDLLEDALKVPADPPPNRQDETEDDVPIIAPADGYVIEKNITPGKAIALTDVTFVIGDLSKVWILAAVHQEDLGKLRTGQLTSVSLPGLEGMRFSGRITNLGQELDLSTRVMQVRIELQNTGGRLRPQMLADAEIPVGGGRPMILVSSEGVQQVNRSGCPIRARRARAFHHTSSPDRLNHEWQDTNYPRDPAGREGSDSR